MTAAPRRRPPSPRLEGCAHGRDPYVFDPPAGPPPDRCWAF